jgi:hypothetical protein
MHQNQSCALVVSRISSQLQLCGFSSEILDDMVLDAAHANAANKANHVCDLDAEAIIDNAEVEVSEINNGGVYDQVAYLIAQLGEKGAIQSIHQATKGAANISVGPFLIYSDSERGYWCNGFGWTSDPEGGTGYCLEDILKGKAVMVEFTPTTGQPEEALGWYWTKSADGLLSGSQGIDFDGPYTSQDEAGFDAITLLGIRPMLISVPDGQYVQFACASKKQ